MKVLISNYIDALSTEPAYFNTVLNNIDCQSSLWPNGLSVYDAFDTMKPDLHITHYSMLNNDIIVYMKENRKIDLIVNITGIDQPTLTKLESIFHEHNIKPSFFFVNCYDHKLHSRKNNIVTILPGADLFLSSEPKRYDIDYAIFVDNEKQIKPIGQTYHYVSCVPDLEKSVDIFLPIERLNHLYHNYQYVVIKYFNNYMPQLFFDAALKTNTFFDVDDRSELNKYLSKILGTDGHCTLEDNSSGDIKNIIRKKHTCLHRTKSLLSQLSCKDNVDRLQSLIERSVK